MSNFMTDSCILLLRYFSQHTLLERVPDVFILLACAYAAMNFVGSILLFRPKKDSEQVENVNKFVLYLICS